MSIKNIFKDSLVYGLSNTLNKFFMVLLVPLYTRLLSQEEFGALDLLVAGMNIAALLLSLEINSGTARLFYEAKERDEEKDLVSTSFWTIWMVSIVGVTVLLMLRNKFAMLLFKEAIHVEWIVLAVCIIPFSLQFNHNLLIFRLLNRKWMYLVFSGGNIFITSLVIVVLIWKFHLGITGIFIGQLTGFLAGLIASTRVLKDYIGPHFSKKYLKEVLAYGAPIVPSTGSSWMQSYANRFLLVAFLGINQVAIYSLAVKVASLILFIQQAFQLAWVPYSISIMGKKGSEDFYARLFNIYLFIMGTIVIILSIFGDEIVNLFAPDNYQVAAKYVGFIAMGIVLMGNSFFALGNNIVKKTFYNTAGFIVGAVCNLLGLYMTVKMFGLAAAAVWYAIGALIANIVILAISQRNHKIPYSYYRYGLFVIVLIVVSIWRLKQEIIHDISPETVLAKLVMTLVIALFFATLILDHEEWKRTKDIVYQTFVKKKIA